MLSDTWARVRHSDADHPVFFLPCADPYLPLRRVCHRLDRITDQVDHNLLYLHLVDQYQRCASVEIEMGPNALLLRTDQSERCRLRDQVRQVLNGLLDFAACDKITQPPNDMSRAIASPAASFSASEIGRAHV